MNYREYLGKTFKCECRQSHEVKTQEIVVDGGAISHLSQIMDRYEMPVNVFVVSDDNTYKAAGEAVIMNLKAGGYFVQEHIFNAQELTHPDEKAVGELMFAMEEEPELIIAVGSGTINDLCRFCATYMKILYMVVATAPSMDGYASTATPITKDGIKRTYKGIHPEIIVGDLYVMRHAPLDMLAAGFGDIAGKIPARLDWLLSSVITGENMCPIVEGITNDAVSKCLLSSDEIINRMPEAVKNVTEALIISGIAMQMNGNSRPASGAEHMISHYLEMIDDEKHVKGAFHGAKVGVTALIMMRIYEKFFSSYAIVQGVMPNINEYEARIKRVLKDKAQIIFDYNDNYFTREDILKEQIKSLENNWNMLKSQIYIFPKLRDKIKVTIAGLSGPTHPVDLGYTKHEMFNAIKYARLLRSRYTILTLLDDLGQLDRFINEVLDEIY